jgi:hypothetical protein
MHQQLLDIGAVRLVGRRVQSKLDRADNFAVEPRRQQHSVPCCDRACDFAKEGESLFMRERRHEADAGAAFDTIGQDISQLIQCGIRNRRIERNDFDGRAHAARSSFDATVASAFSR